LRCRFLSCTPRVSLAARSGLTEPRKLRPMALDRERFLSQTYGYSQGEWESARDWTTRRLRKVARDRTTIPYSDLSSEMAQAGEIPLEPHSSALAALLGHVNLLEYEEGRPLISALVIYKGGDAEPGPGFWNFAKALGIDVGSGSQARLDFWSREVERCYECWGRP
jgi:hypothetical protein